MWNLSLEPIYIYICPYWNIVETFWDNTNLGHVFMAWEFFRVSPEFDLCDWRHWLHEPFGLIDLCVSRLSTAWLHRYVEYRFDLERPAGDSPSETPRRQTPHRRFPIGSYTRRNACDVPLIVIRFWHKFEYVKKLLQNSSVPNDVKIGPTVLSLFHTGRRTDTWRTCWVNFDTLSYRSF